MTLCDFRSSPLFFTFSCFVAETRILPVQGESLVRLREKTTTSKEKGGISEQGATTVGIGGKSQEYRKAALAEPMEGEYNTYHARRHGVRRTLAYSDGLQFQE